MARAEELQHVDDPEEFWKRFREVMGGPDGLMTYRYLGTQSDLSAGGDAGMTVRRDMRNPAGGLMAAPLGIVLAEAGGPASDAGGVPAPVFGSVHVLDDGRDVKRVRARTRWGSRGRTIGFGQAEVYDEANPDRILAVTLSQGVNVGEAPPGFTYVDPGPGVPDSPQLPPLHEAFGAERRPDGRWQLPELSQRIGSTSGSLHHGPIQIVLEALAMELAAKAAGTDQLQIEDWSVQYVARGKIGPFVADGEVVAGNLNRYACRVTLSDEGNGGRICSTALAVFRPAA
jgi:hypothetical protein